MLKELGTSIYCAEGDHWMPGRLYFPVRMTVVELPDGGLWVHSPIAWTEELGAAVDALGPVRHLVAPSLMHHVYLGEWIERYPDARVWAARGLADKREDLEVDGEIWEDAPPAWGGAIRQLPIEGAPGVNEVVFYHEDSGSLLVTDLFFNIHDVRGAMAWLMLTLTGTKRRFAMSRSWRMIFVKDRAAAGRSARALLRWDFSQVVVAHGEVVVEDAHARAAEALSWMVSGAPAPALREQVSAG